MLGGLWPAVAELLLGRFTRIMDIPLDIQVLSPKQGTAPVLLSVGYGNAHVVTEITGAHAIETLLSFIFEHRDKRGAHWLETGRFGSCPVTFYLSDDDFAFIIDSDLAVDGFGQSAGLYIPRDVLNDFTDILAREHRKYVEKTAASYEGSSGKD